MKIANDWKDYSVLACGDGEKLERWGEYILLRPDPQVIWHWQNKPLVKPHAHYHRSDKGGGEWEYFKPLPQQWSVKWRNLTFLIKPMGFKHTGLFPEQAVNWQQMIDMISSVRRPVNVLNLFAYTGGATAACAYAGASVCHVDSAKNMVERAKENLAASGLAQKPVRYIVEDCQKFLTREIKRGNFYDAIIMDPPSYGRGPNGEMWKIEENLFDFLTLCAKVLCPKPLFVLINSYTTGLQPLVLKNLLSIVLKDFEGSCEAYEVALPTQQEGIYLPCGASAMFKGKGKGE